MRLCRLMAGLFSILLPGDIVLGNDDAHTTSREQMVKSQLLRGGINDPQVLQAMKDVPRHEFVPVSLRSYAYQDGPLPIGHGQTISQPFIVAFMTQALHRTKNDKVLEVGTGSGYQAAILGKLAKEVYTIEIVPPLAETSRQLLA
ncbi:MAG TPA: protein-L-isoaspartate O-methyltransferase, partial [Terrimicrobiaceae bacterium]